MNEQLLAAFLDDREQLSDAQFAELLSAIRTDPALAALLHQSLVMDDLLSRTIGSLRGNFHAQVAMRIRDLESPPVVRRNAIQNAVSEMKDRREQDKPATQFRKWQVFRSGWGLAAAASLAIVAGVWLVCRPQAGSLELRVAEVRGKVVGGRWQVGGGRWEGAGGRGQVAGATESPSHPVTQSKATSPTPLRVGDILRPGDGVEVGADGVVKLAYRDGTQVELRQNTRLRVTLGEGENTDAKRLALDGGKMVCSIAPQKRAFEIWTRQAVNRVVGTRFSLDATDPRSVLAVMEGKVELRQGEKSLLVSAGESATATDQGMEMMPKETRTSTPMRSGRVWAWGQNLNGQLGNGTTNDSPNPVLVPELDGVMAVAAEFGHTVALKSDGTVVAWGMNNVGQLGDGTTMPRLRPVPVPGLSGIVAIAAGDTYTLALKNDGRVFAWGENADGQLGDGTTNNRATPAPVPGLSDVMAIAGGQNYCVALKRDQTVWAWGRNGSGQLGDGTRSNNRLVPVQVKMADGTPLGGVTPHASPSSRKLQRDR